MRRADGEAVTGSFRSSLVDGRVRDVDRNSNNPRLLRYGITCQDGILANERLGIHYFFPQKISIFPCQPRGYHNMEGTLTHISARSHSPEEDCRDR